MGYFPFIFVFTILQMSDKSLPKSFLVGMPSFVFNHIIIAHRVNTELSYYAHYFLKDNGDYRVIHNLFYQMEI